MWRVQLISSSNESVTVKPVWLQANNHQFDLILAALRVSDCFILPASKHIYEMVNIMTVLLIRKVIHQKEAVYSAQPIHSICARAALKEMLLFYYVATQRQRQMFVGWPLRLNLPPSFPLHSVAV